MFIKKFLFQVKSLGGCVFQPFQSWVRSENLRKRTRYASYYKHKKIKGNVVLYEAFFGRGMLDNPYAIFLQLISDRKYKHLRHVWVLDNIDDNKILVESYKKCKNVIFIQYESKEYMRYLCTAKYLVNNVTFPYYFTKKPGQVYINTWHGIPLKHLGFDMPNGNTETTNVLRNFLHADYILSTCPFLTEVYNSAYKLKNLYEGSIVEEGYPRLDILTRFQREKIFEKFNMYGVQADSNKKIILYAPTWRGASYKNANSDIDIYYQFKKVVEQHVDTSVYQILVKVHQRVYELAKEKLSDGFFIPACIDANEVLSVTDILVSDFSSIFYDFLATGRPVLFYIPDINKYKNERGLYGDISDLPGPCASSMEEVCRYINDIDKIFSQYKDKYKEVRTWSGSGIEGNISKKITDIVFEGKSTGYKIYSPVNDGKIKILFYRGMFLTNGITSSFINLLDNIDYSKLDITVLVSSDNSLKNMDLINGINRNVRVVYKNSEPNATFLEQAMEHYCSRFGEHKASSAMHAREALRQYGTVSFDYVVDFEGYNIFYNRVLLQFTKACKAVWLHNDMMAEASMRFSWLEQVFGRYQYFDYIISCSREIMVVNRENMAGKYAEYKKFRYAKNSINAERVIHSTSQNVLREYEGKTYIAADEENIDSCVRVNLVPYIKNGSNGKRVYRFVTVGRLSPEKNHERLIYAFYELYKKYEDVYLYICGGGILEHELRELVYGLNLQGHVFLTGNVNNPFAVMKYCDCFILPSLHEGQPMVIHEARIMHMPVIVSGFSSVKGCLIENGQLLVGTSEDEIYRGMEEFLNGNVPCAYQFDAEIYNKEAYNEFLNALELREILKIDADIKMENTI